jgi:hypothetical protein
VDGTNTAVLAAAKERCGDRPQVLPSVSCETTPEAVVELIGSILITVSDSGIADF